MRGHTLGRSTTFGFMLVMVTVLFAPIVPQAQSQRATPNPAKVADLKMGLRDLLVNHIFWVRDLVISTRLGVKALVGEGDEYGEKNAKAVGHSIDPFYGQAAGAKFARLFVGHYSAVKDYMNAAFKNNYKGSASLKKAALDELMNNANEIAAFLSSANPNLPKGTVYGLFLTHAQQHMRAIDATAKKDWAGEADMWDPMVKHDYTMADAIADAIAKQFPDKFQ
jgi:hypothetical protein